MNHKALQACLCGGPDFPIAILHTGVQMLQTCLEADFWHFFLILQFIAEPGEKGRPHVDFLRIAQDLGD